jgi:hypothetical protein
VLQHIYGIDDIESARKCNRREVGELEPYILNAKSSCDITVSFNLGPVDVHPQDLGARKASGHIKRVVGGPATRVQEVSWL